MDLQPTLENDLVRIRPMINSDLESLYRAAKDPEIWKQHPCNRYLRGEFEEFFAESIESKGALIIIDINSNQIIGSSRFKLVDGFPDGVEIGWTFLERKYWGGDYNISIKNLMIEHAFKFVNNIIFYVDNTNMRSQKAVEKIGGTIIEESEYKNLPKTNSDILTYVINNRNGT